MLLSPKKSTAPVGVVERGQERGACGPEHEMQSRCTIVVQDVAETSPTSPTAVANLVPVFARVSQQDQVIMQSGSQALATLRSHVPPLLRCMCDESLIPHVTLDFRLHAPSLPAQGRGLPTPTAVLHERGTHC